MELKSKHIILYYLFITIVSSCYSQKSDKPSIFPLDTKEYFKITSLFGQRTHPITGKVKFHSGIDIAARVGTFVYATADGIIQKVNIGNSSGGYGNFILIKHSNTYSTKYAHLARYYQVYVGKKIKKGDIIGFVGTTGRSTGNHLHYEVIKNGARIDPAPFLLE